MGKLPEIFLLATSILGFTTMQVQGQVACDRACLEGITDQYLAAMVAHDPSRAPFADHLVFTENAIRLPPTEGLWFTASGLGDFQIYISDLHQGQVAWVGIAREHDVPVILSMRLKVVDRLITEAESIVIRNLEERNLVNLRTPPPALSEPLPASQRVSRQELIRITHTYFDAIEKLDDREVPFHEQCYRLENGMLTAGTSPTEPGKSADLPCANGDIPPILKTIHTIHPRRTAVVDEERGITWGIYCFNHRGLAAVELPDGTMQPTYFSMPNTMPVAEIFKITGGKIRDILGFGTPLPYGSGDGWSAPVFQQDYNQAEAQ